MANAQIPFGNSNHTVSTIDLCPVCNRHSEMTVNPGVQVFGRPYNAEVVVRCGYSGCRSHVILRYKFRGTGQGQAAFEIINFVPEHLSVTSFHKAIVDISPTFVEVYNQAERARQLGLAYIAGPGFRKAFEFLIKDYAIGLNPDNATKVKAELAAQVVRSHITDARIQAVAKRALWVGNDETHYERRWEDKDIDDLVVLIDITAKWIETESLTKSYIEEMPDGRQ